MNLAEIQQELRNQKLYGWLFFDHHLRDPLAYRVLGLTPPGIPTRRWYYLIPAEGEPRGLEHRIERGMTAGLPGRRIPYSSWAEQVEGLRQITSGLRSVAMQYSPNCAIPYVSMVDAGTVELVRSLGIDVVSSAELIQYFEARWSPEALESHLEAGRRVDRVRAEAFAMVRERTLNGSPLQEVEMKEFVRGGFADVANGGLTILAEQSVPLDQFDATQLAGEIKNAEEDVADASTDEARRVASEKLDQLKELKAGLAA